MNQYNMLGKDPLHNKMIPSVNFHLTDTCNMGCNHCYATDLGKNPLKLGDAMRIVGKVALYGFEKINYAGGEPMLFRGLDSLIREAKKMGMTTSMVTNGTMITDTWLNGIRAGLDWIALSIDSTDSRIHAQMGRATQAGPIPTTKYVEIIKLINKHKIRLKVNTVITELNYNDDFTQFISEIEPDRWKVMQVLRVDGQNDRNPRLFMCTDDKFERFTKRHEHIGNKIPMVIENNNMMTESYAMINPEGKFYDNANGIYNTSRPILDVGVEEALSDVSIDPEKFTKRGGYYKW